MEKKTKGIEKPPPVKWLQQRCTAICTNLKTNHLWQRLLKNVIATTICAILAVTPSVVSVFGTAAYLAPIVTVFGHPGRRFGQMAEALILAVMGALIGTAWSTLAIHLSSLVVERNLYASYTIKALFLTVSFLVHGYLRSHSPRLFLGVVIEVIVSVVSLTGATQYVSTTLITTLLYPILSAVGVILLVNVVVFPEFSSSFLGNTTIETLEETITSLRDAGDYFVIVSSPTAKQEESVSSTDKQTPSSIPVKLKSPAYVMKDNLWRRLLRAFRSNPTVESSQKKSMDKGTVKLSDLTARKAKLRAKLAACKAAQQECTFELAYAVLPPKDLKIISDISMKKLVANTISVIGACESKYALMGDAQVEQTVVETPKAPISRQTDKQESPDVNGKTAHAEESAQYTPKSFRNRGPLPSLFRQVKTSKDQEKSNVSSKDDLAQEKQYIESVKPRREIESGNIKLLQRLLTHISPSVNQLQVVLDRTMLAITACLAYSYDVDKLPSGARPPAGIRLDELDIQVEDLETAIVLFDETSGAALQKVAAVQVNLDNVEDDIMPRMETFLISSFLLNLRQAALHTSEMLKHCRILVEKRQNRHGRRKFHVPNIDYQKWLSSADPEDGSAMTEAGKREARKGGGHQDRQEEEVLSSQETLVNTHDVVSNNTIVATLPRENMPLSHHKKNQEHTASTRQLRVKLADVIDYLLDSDDIFYAIKLTIAVWLVCFPAFVPSLKEFFLVNRALWASLQLVLVFEVALGVSIWTFFVRALGTTIGCVWGFAAYEIGSGNRVVLMAMLVIGFIPSAYVQLGSKYVKAGMVSIISMSVVAIGTLEPIYPGTSVETFLRRLVAFFIGGVVAVAVEVFLFPTRARDRLVESVATSVQRISDMEACLAYGVESEANVTDLQSIQVLRRFEAARGKAQTAMAAAEVFLPACAHEPRLKGSFKGHTLIYSEILYVLHAILDRMDGMHHLRHTYGSGVLEEFNAQIFPYRRNVAGSITLILFAVQEALTTRMPLPQFLPSARLAHLRLVNRVREVVAQRNPQNIGDTPDTEHSQHPNIEIVKKIFHQKFLAWNAVAAGHIEIIEYLEELVDLVKLLVGADEFESGMFTRKRYQQYVRKTHAYGNDDGKTCDDETEQMRPMSSINDEVEEQRDAMPEPELMQRSAATRRRTMSQSLSLQKSGSHSNVLHRSDSKSSSGEPSLPYSLQRVRSRRLEEMDMQKLHSKEEKGKNVMR